MNKANKGDLVYVPSGVRLFKVSTGGAVSNYKNIEKPLHLLVTEVHDSTYEVMCDRELWLIEQNKTYGAKT